MTGFYVLEATVVRPFSDPVGPPDLGWLAQPWLAACEIEAATTTQQTLRASDIGYVSRVTDPQGVQAYPARIVDAITVDVAANLDLTASNVAASWGSVSLSNTDNFYDALIAGWRADGQVITIYRGDKTLDATRGIYLDPAWASLQPIFAGVMSAWLNQTNKVTIPLRDAAFYLAGQFPRRVYAGTGGAEGTVQLTGVTKPILYCTLGGRIFNATPLLIDPANLVYQITESDAALWLASAVYDGGVALTPNAVVADVYAASAPPAGTYNSGNGMIRLGSSPVFALTVDSTLNLISGTSVTLIAYAVLVDIFKVPAALIGNSGGSRTLTFYGVNPGLSVAMGNTVAGYYIASGETLDGLAFFSRLMATSGLLLVPGRDAKLRLLMLAAIPNGTTSVLTFNDTNVVSITSVPLPDSVVPPPFRLRLGYNRNYTVQIGTQMAGGAPADVVTFDAVAARAAVGVGPAQQGAFGQLNDPPMIGEDNYAVATSISGGASAAQQCVNAMIALWGVPRYLYEIVVPQSVGMTLDWASVVTVVSDFDGLQAGKQGQIVGWQYSSAEATTMFRVLV